MAQRPPAAGRIVPDAAVRILHLSDIHFRSGTAWDSDPVLRALARFIAGEVAAGLAPDLVVITGDLAFAGRSEEYDLARAWLEQALWPAVTPRAKPPLPRDRLLLVPGNHDVDRSKVDAVAQMVQDGLLAGRDQNRIATVLADSTQREVLLKRHADYLAFYGDWRGEPQPLPWWQRVIPIDHQRLHVAGLDSAWMSSGDSERGKLLLGRWQIHQTIDPPEAEGADWRIALLHHPWDYLAEFDGSEARQAIHLHRDLVLRGHLHEGDTSLVRPPDPARACLELAAGCVYEASRYPNAFHWIELYPNPRRVRVLFRVWNKGAWQVDRNQPGCPEGVAEIPMQPATAPARAVSPATHSQDFDCWGRQRSDSSLVRASSPKRTHQLDDRMQRLLLEINAHGGRHTFNPPHRGSAEDIRQYNLDVNCLKEMQQRGFIPPGKLKVRDDPRRNARNGGPQYLYATVDGLSYEAGKLAEELARAAETPGPSNLVDRRAGTEAMAGMPSEGPEKPAESERARATRRKQGSGDGSEITRQRRRSAEPKRQSSNGHDRQCDVLLLYVNDREREGIIGAFKGPRGGLPKPRTIDGLPCLDLSKINGKRVLALATNMGSATPGGSATVTHDAIQKLDPEWIIAVGIAFGMDPEKTPIGTILVSDRVSCYEPRRVGKGKTIRRGDTVTVDYYLLQHLRTVSGKDYWNGAEVCVGELLSGEKLIDDPGFKGKLRQEYPEAIGGEMEAAGIYSAAMLGGCAWIVVKAVCDFADGNKGEDKEARQRLAAANAAAFVRHCLGAYAAAEGRSPTRKDKTTTPNTPSASSIREVAVSQIAAPSDPQRDTGGGADQTAPREVAHTGSPVQGNESAHEEGPSQPVGFDCFFSYNSKDRPGVLALKKELVARGLSIWLDVEQCLGGRSAQTCLESGIRASRSVAFLVGAEGIGPWQREEQECAIALAVGAELPVMPVLLPDAPLKPDLPLLLANRTWVDLRPSADYGSETGLDFLVRSIRAGNPDPRSAGQPAEPARGPHSDPPRPQARQPAGLPEGAEDGIAVALESCPPLADALAKQPLAAGASTPRALAGLLCRSSGAGSAALDALDDALAAEGLRQQARRDRELARRLRDAAWEILGWLAVAGVVNGYEHQDAPLARKWREGAVFRFPLGRGPGVEVLAARWSGAGARFDREPARYAYGADDLTPTAFPEPGVSLDDLGDQPEVELIFYRIFQRQYGRYPVGRLPAAEKRLLAERVTRWKRDGCPVRLVIDDSEAGNPYAADDVLAAVHREIPDIYLIRVDSDRVDDPGVFVLPPEKLGAAIYSILDKLKAFA